MKGRIYGIGVYHPIQKYKFESKSQLFSTSLAPVLWCITQYKNTNLKANHNLSADTLYMDKVYHPIQKYKFESKSQHLATYNLPRNWCITQYKNTNLKANHNRPGDR